MKDEDAIANQVRASVREGAPGDTAADLVLINKNALEPLTTSDVYLFEAIPSNDAVDSYFTQMADSSLKNYTRDLKQGRALMNSHRRHDTLPLGYSYDADLDVAAKIITAKYFLQRGLELGGVHNDHVIKGIQGGTVRDVSIGFKPGWYRCAICGKDLMSDMPGMVDEPGARCDHIPGIVYEKTLCVALVEDGYLAETSLVFDGATPGAIIKKAMEAYKRREIEPRDVERLEGVLGVRFTPTGGLVTVPDLEKFRAWTPPDPDRPAGGGWDENETQYRYRVKDPGLFHQETFRTANITTGVNAIMAKLKSDAGALADKPMKVQSVVFAKKTFKTIEEAKAWLKDHADLTRGGESMDMEEVAQWLEAETMVRWLEAETMVGWLEVERLEGNKVTTAAIDALVAKYEKESGQKYHAPADREALGEADVEDFSKDAEVGRAFLKDIVEATVQVRIRAQGTTFDADKYRAMLMSGKDLAFIRGELKSYGSDAEMGLYAGRAITPAPPAGEPADKPQVSATAREAKLNELAEEEVKLVNQ